MGFVFGHVLLRMISSCKSKLKRICTYLYDVWNGWCKIECVRWILMPSVGLCIWLCLVPSSGLICAHSAKRHFVPFCSAFKWNKCGGCAFHSIRYAFASSCRLSGRRSSLIFSFLIKIKYNLFPSFKLNRPKSCRRSVTPARFASYTNTRTQTHAHTHSLHAAIQINK